MLIVWAGFVQFIGTTGDDEPAQNSAGVIDTRERGRFAGGEAVTAVNVAAFGDELTDAARVIGAFLEHMESAHDAVSRVEVAVVAIGHAVTTIGALAVAQSSQHYRLA